MVKDDKDKRNVVLQALDSMDEHHQALNYSVVSGIKHQDQTNGSFEHHHQSCSPSNTEGLMASELIASCLSTWLMIQVKLKKGKFKSKSLFLHMTEMERELAEVHREAVPTS